MFIPPLVFIGLSFAAGIAAAFNFGPAPLLALAAGVASLLLALLCYVKHWRGLTPAIILVFFISGAILGWVQHRPGGVENIIGHRVVCWGVISGEPDTREDRVYYPVSCQGILLGGRKAGAGVSILVRVPRQEGDLVHRYGDSINARGLLSFPERPGNPGQFDYGDYLLGQGIAGVLYVDRPQDVERIGTGGGNIILALSLKLKERLTRVTAETISGENAALVNGLIFGARGTVPPDTMEAFNQAGISHILSVSGMNVAFVLAGALWLTGLAGLGPLARLPLLLFVLTLYWLMTGMGPAVSRATLMAVVLLLGRHIGRDTHWGASLTLAGLVILALNPSALVDAGFQLSFAATWGILYLGSFFSGFLCKVRGLPRGLALLVGISMGAQLATMPLTAYHFNLLPVLSLPANMLVVPLVGLMLPLGVLASVLGLVWLPGAALVNIATSALADVMRLLAYSAAKLPGAYFYLPGPDPLWVAMFYLLLIALALPREIIEESPAKSAQRNLAVFLLAAFLLGLGWNTWLPPGDKLEVHVIDVGQGESLLVKFPGGKVMLVDVGGRPGEFSSGRGAGEVVTAYLRGQGIREINTLVLTHPHEDHAGGAGAVLGRFKVGEMVVSPFVTESLPAPGEAGALRSAGAAKSLGSSLAYGDEGAGGRGAQTGEDGYLMLLNKAFARGIPVWAAQRGHLLWDEGGVSVYVLGPPGQLFKGTRSDSNNNSLVLAIRHGDNELLFTGDIEVEAQEELASAGVLPAAGLLKVPHHGSSFITREFVQRINPRAAIISVGSRNNFGMPAPGCLGLLEENGCRVYRTDKNGAVIISSDGRELKIATGKR